MWQTSEKIFKIGYGCFMAARDYQGYQGYDAMIFAAVVPLLPPPDVHYLCFTNSFRCEELIYQKWDPYHHFYGK